MLKNNRQASSILALIGYCMGIIGFNGWLLYTKTIWHPFGVCVMSCGLGLAFWTANKHMKEFEVKKRGLIYAFSLLFAVFAVLDQRIVHTGLFSATVEEAYLQPIGIIEIVIAVLLSAFVFQSVRTVFVLVAFVLRKMQDEKLLFGNKWKLSISGKHFQLSAFLTLMVSWSVFWLTYFPGTGMSDVLWIWNSPIYTSAQHTLTYNYLLYGLMVLGKAIGGDWFWGVALYTFVQLVYCAWSVSYVLNWLRKRDVPGILVIAILMYFTFSRIVPNISVQSVKDTIFSFNLLLMIPLLFDCAETEGRSLMKPCNLLLFALTSALTILIRNNGILVMIGIVFFVIIACHRFWKNVVALCLAIVIIPWATDSILMNTLVRMEKIAVESLGIPLQQMAAVVARGGDMNEEEAAIMQTIMPREEMAVRYRPTIADSLKWGEGAQYLNKAWIAENQGEFLKTWASMLIKNLDIYVEAYLLETLSYWNVGLPCTEQGLYYTYPQDSMVALTIEQVRILPEALHNSLQDYYQLDTRTDSPSGGTIVWLLLLIMLFCVSTGQLRKTLCFLPVVLVWGTVMLSAPIAYGFRYVFALYLACPFLVVIPVIRSKETVVVQ